MYIKLQNKYNNNKFNIVITHLQADYILDNKISESKSLKNIKKYNYIKFANYQNL